MDMDEGNMTTHSQSNVSNISMDDDEMESTYKCAPEIPFFSTSIGILVVIITIIGTLVIICVPMMIYFWRKRRYRYITKEVLDEFFADENSFPLGESLSRQDLSSEVSHNELLPSEFNIDEENILGQGVYGKICRGTVCKNGLETEVAVKMLVQQPSGSGTRISEFLQEIKNLSYLGKHPHILELVGVYTAKLKNGKIFSFHEICPLGSLETYLRKQKSAEIKISNRESHLVNEYACENEESRYEKSLTSDMFRWSYEIASALEYISSKRVVLIDIATRNIFLTTGKHAKLADFGLSRRLHDYDQYMMMMMKPILFPWRWLSPESLRGAVFSEKSDVWALGVTFWEIFSLGDVPYTGLLWDVNFVTKLERGLRLGTTRYGGENIYSIMLRCWATRPEMRPTFSELSGLVRQQLVENIEVVI